jgi:hypothetical protein
MNEDSTEYKVGTFPPWYARKWWMRVREVESVTYSDGSVGGCAEFYVPWWSWPFELLHRLIFGNPKVELAEYE